MFYISKQSIENYPFDKLFEFVHTRIKSAVDTLTEEAMTVHTREAERKIALLYKNKEGSYEGNLEEDFPFSIDPEVLESEKLRVKKESVALFLDKYDAKALASWLLPQAISTVGRLPISRNEAGKIDSTKFLQNFAVDNWHKGLWYFLTHASRGDYVPKQYTVDSRNYSALVPLILAPFKKFDGIAYSEWDIEGLNRLVDPNLWQAMTLDFDTSDIPTETIIEAREVGLSIKTGKDAGKTRSPTSTHKLYGVPGPFNKLPWLAQVMFFQIWVAHPANRTELMILDWNNWDNMPKPLIDVNVGIVKQPTLKKVVETSLPWDI